MNGSNNSNALSIARYRIEPITPTSIVLITGFVFPRMIASFRLALLATSQNLKNASSR